MRLLSRFKDFYDGYFAYETEDDGLFYLRAEEVQAVEVDYHVRRRYTTWDGPEMMNISVGRLGSNVEYYDTARFEIHFCGQTIRGIQLQVHKEGKETYHFFYDAEDYATEVQKILSKKALKIFQGGGRGRGPYRRWWGRYEVFTTKGAREYFQGEGHGVIPWLKEAGLDFADPIYLVVDDNFEPPESMVERMRNGKLEGFRRQNVVIFNIRLADLEFWKVKDDWTTFNELKQWMSNQVQPQMPMPEISDELKAETHGFDRKTSFRGPTRIPTKKPRRRGKKRKG